MSSKQTGARLLDGLRVLELGRGLAAAVCGNVFAGLGADVVRAGHAPSSPVDGALSAGKRLTGGEADAVARLAREADLVVVASGEGDAGLGGFDLDGLRRDAPGAVVVAITPFGLSGPYRDFAGGDLIAFHGSGIARLLIGPVADPQQEPPVRAAGEQSQFIAGVTAACAAMPALYAAEGGGEGQLIDVSVQEALACMAIRNLAQPAFDQTPVSRRRVAGDGVTVTILPASDGHIAISPREAHQWKAWVGVMGDPEWARDGQFDDRAVKVARWGELHALMSQWSSQHTKAEIFEAGQDAHVPCFPLSSPAELLDSPQLEHRRSFRSLSIEGTEVRTPGLPFGFAPGAEGTAEGGGVEPARPSRGVEWRKRPALAETSYAAPPEGPLGGVRVLDFSWVIAGPTCTRYLAAMGAEVLKVESAGRPDPGRASELHAVLGQGKRGIALNLRAPEAVAIARRLVAQSDVVVENFATGVMGRLGLGDDVLFELRPDLVLVSASGLGRKGPEAGRVAYGTLLQCFTGFAGMNGYPGRPPAAGMAWLDPMCGLLMASATVAALRERRASGRGRRIDFSMVEALLWTMPGPLLDYQLNGRAPQRAGNDDPRHSPHGVYRCAGDDAWLAVAVTSDEQWRALCAAVETLRAIDGSAGWSLAQRLANAEAVDAAISGWAAGRAASEAWIELQRAGVPAAPANSSLDLFADRHLRERGFYRPGADIDGVERLLPGLPWQVAGVAAPRPGPAPALGADTDAVLREVLGIGDEELAALHSAGALE